MSPAMAAIQKKTLKRDGVAVYYEVSGAGAPVLLLHGIGGDLEAWSPIRDALVAAGHTVAAMDLRGHGYSGHPRAAAQNKVSQLVDDAAALVRAEGFERTTVVGHCYGATVAALLSARYPALVERLVLICPTDRPPRYLHSRALRSLALGALAVGAAVSPPAVGHWHSPYPPGKYHKDYEFWGLMRTLFYNSARSYLFAVRELLTQDVRGALGQIAAPTLLIAAGQDSIFPPVIAEDIRGRIKGSALVVMANSNHPVILNEPLKVAEQIKAFLARAPQTQG